MADSVGMLIFKDKQLRLLLILFNSNKEWHINDLATAAKVTYIHTSRFVTRCEEAGIMGSETHGRMKRLFLTDKGKEIAQELNVVLNKINQAAAAQAQPAKPVPPPQVKPQPAPQKEMPAK
jgi:DNA-binding MarR family transcriptional regulator